MICTQPEGRFHLLALLAARAFLLLHLLVVNLLPPVLLAVDRLAMPPVLASSVKGAV
jgi:hypothetical protein